MEIFIDKPIVLFHKDFDLSACVLIHYNIMYVVYCISFLSLLCDEKRKGNEDVEAMTAKEGER